MPVLLELDASCALLLKVAPVGPSTIMTGCVVPKVLETMSCALLATERFPVIHMLPIMVTLHLVETLTLPVILVLAGHVTVWVPEHEAAAAVMLFVTAAFWLARS